jgi:hypothetical protein
MESTMHNYKSLALAILVFMIITALCSFSGSTTAAQQMALNHNDSLAISRNEYPNKVLTYSAHAGDSLKITVINLDVPFMKTYVDIVLHEDDNIQFKFKDLFTSVPDRSFIVIKINSEHYYKDIYVEKSAVF